MENVRKYRAGRAKPWKKAIYTVSELSILITS